MVKRNKIPVSKTHNHLMLEWDFGKNEIRPEDVVAGSHKKVWWVCRVCGYRWKTVIRKRAMFNRGCWVCTKQVLVYENSLVCVFPEVAKDWHPQKNGSLTAACVSKSTPKKYWWLCSTCGHEWLKTVNARTSAGRGCPACANRVVTEDNNLKATHPVLALEWHPYKNNRLLSSDVVSGSSKKVWWKCSDAGCLYEWRALIFNRTKKIKPRGCPACAGKAVTKLNNLAVCRPDLLKEWDFEKNKDFLPTEVFKCSKKRVWWLCLKCSFKWEAQIYGRHSDNTGCPECSKTVGTETFIKNKIQKEGSLKQRFPDLCKEWDYIKNKDVFPELITYGSKKRVWWSCSNEKCRHSWEAFIFNRTKGNGCPKCSGGSVSKVSQEWLDSLGVKIREYYIKDLK
ncbi:MAG: zinc-ribbon domain-containing protein, partial [Candidatus Peribacteraceae bacterium]|nr:zinc-ribbon domain-containing protein [Candidatus Peribacteraceae bacterium]